MVLSNSACILAPYSAFFAEELELASGFEWNVVSSSSYLRVLVTCVPVCQLVIISPTWHNQRLEFEGRRKNRGGSLQNPSTTRNGSVIELLKLRHAVCY
jgi:hypothetical protein